MSNQQLAEKIKNGALALGFDKCGIIRVSELTAHADFLAERIKQYPSERAFLEQFSGFADVAAKRPWAKSAVVLVHSYGQYKIPENLKGRIASFYLFVEGATEKADGQAFGAFLTECGIKGENDWGIGLTSVRRAAEQAGLGLIRKNGFFYTREHGSWVFLTVWLIDRELELKEENNLKPCPENCDKCLKACPTSALRGTYSTKPTDCISYLAGLGGDVLVDHPAAPGMKGWIYGCDNCQAACPHNHIKGYGETDLPGLTSFAEKVSLEKIMDLDYDSLGRIMVENFHYIPKNRLWKWKINVLNAMKNSYKSEYRPYIERASRDSAEQVRSMARWVLASVA